MNSKSLLVELLVEELPPKSLKKLGEVFADTLAASLKAQGLAAAESAVTAYATPRRLAVQITNVAAQAADKAVSQKLMPVSVGLDAAGQATPALLKKLSAFGADASVLPQLKRTLDGKTETLFFDSMVKGVTLSAGLQTALDETLAKLPIPKVMSYQLADGWQSVNFVRPAHGLVALHGDEVVPVSVLGLQSGRATQGHRFEAKASAIAINSADSYEAQIETEGAVAASFAKRREQIAVQLAAVAAREKLSPIVDEALLDEVTALVERPNVLAGTFEKEFLQVPQECLILTMKANQKYFPLLDGAGKLSNKFLIVSNIHPADSSLIVGGNERVIRARLADAKFFFDQDRKKTLASRLAGLDKVVYHNKLGTHGSLGERIQRVRAIAKAIAQQLGGDVLAAQADQAAMLAKADLTTDMVGEFPELQGIMGRYYAQAEGIRDDIAFAIEDHYKPRFAGDELPRNMVGICVALADKLETLVGMFSIGEIPTGDNDRFALRRHALGVLRMLIEKELPLELNQLVEFSAASLFDKEIQQRVDQATYQAEFERKQKTERGAFVVAVGRGERQFVPDATKHLLSFVFERLSGYLREQGYSATEVEAVLCLNPVQLYLVPKQLAAVRGFAALPEAESLAAANKRVGNILKKAEGVLNGVVNSALLHEPAEKALYLALSEIAPKANAAFEKQDYTESLQMLAALKTPIDVFFDKVMVNADDVALRNNRLTLLSQLQQTMNRVADISKLAT